MSLPDSYSDLKNALADLEAEIDDNAPPEQIAPRLREVISKLEPDNPLWPKGLRLAAVVKNRLALPDDAIADLGEAKALATKQLDYEELANIYRETAIVYAWRGDDRTAALELLHALALACLTGDRESIGRALAEVGRVELEARRFDRVALLLRNFSKTLTDCLSSRQAQRTSINLCQALNQIGEYEEVLRWISQLSAEIPEGDKRLAILKHLEEARALAGLGRSDAADESLRAAKRLIACDKDHAFEYLEYLEAEAELQLLKGEQIAISTFERLIAEYSDRKLIVRTANTRLTLANALLKLGRADQARQTFGDALRSAVNAELSELADRIRGEMLKSQQGDIVCDLSHDVEAIAGGSSLNRRFIFLNPLGRGGFALVQRALDLRDGQEVALKKLSLGSLYNAATRQRLLASVKSEYAVATSLPHPGIARVRDLVMSPEGTIYIVQDYIPGPTLREVFRSGTPPSRLLLILADIAETLAVLHANGLVHRDLKPENVILRNTEVPVLIDFGLALLIGKSDLLKHLGTADYIAPEQARGGTVDIKADIYALGKMIAEIWDIKSTWDLFVSVSYSNQYRAMPWQMRRLAWRMLRKNPKRRLGSLDFIACELRSASKQLELEENAMGSSHPVRLV